MSFRLVHCADLHIGTSFSSLCAQKAKIRKNELLQALSDIVEFCKEKTHPQVRFFFIPLFPSIRFFLRGEAFRANGV